MILRIMTRIREILLAVIVSSSSINCVTEQPNEISDIIDEDFEDSLPQPRFSNPTPRPLNRVLIQWLEIENSDGYEIQMSTTDSFDTIKKMWIVKGTKLEISIPQNGPMWLRIRAFNANAVSDWSTVLAIREIL